MKLATRRWVFGLLWGLTSTAGLWIGSFFAFILVMGSASQWLILFAGVGFGLGAGQSFALLVCTRFNRASLWWLPLTVIGSVVGALLGFPLEEVSTVGVLAGLSLGISQWLLLGKWVGMRSLLWILVNAVTGSIAISLIDRGLRASGSGTVAFVLAWAIAILPSTFLIAWLMPIQTKPSSNEFDSLQKP
ncbi:MAG: hypothetical protein VKL39_22170 [Leptolyngbyaceae bacterium]|nr:hypothetical protein [Leptolyngbyaceae bacterium]